MQYASIDSGRSEAYARGRAECPVCGSIMIAKCGPRNINHWAHFKTRDCDPWWENETPWHRDWRNYFPEDCREVSHTAEDGEIHRADIKTPKGIVIEVQHLSMTDKERSSRENFYQNLVWVLDGSTFIDNFDIYHMLPDPESEIAKDIVWVKAKRRLGGAAKGIYHFWSEAREEEPYTKKQEANFGLYHFLCDSKDKILKTYKGHHQYEWVRPRKTWLDSQCPVYIDFGTEYLVRLMTYDESGLECMQYVSKRKFIDDAMNEDQATNIATRFFRLPEHDINP